MFSKWFLDDEQYEIAREGVDAMVCRVVNELNGGKPYYCPCLSCTNIHVNSAWASVPYLLIFRVQLTR